MFSPGQVSIYEIENIKSRRGNKILVCSEEKGAHSSEIVRGVYFGRKVKVAQKNNNNYSHFPLYCAKYAITMVIFFREVNYLSFSRKK